MKHGFSRLVSTPIQHYNRCPKNITEFTSFGCLLALSHVPFLLFSYLFFFLFKCTRYLAGFSSGMDEAIDAYVHITNTVFQPPWSVSRGPCWMEIFWKVSLVTLCVRARLQLFHVTKCPLLGNRPWPVGHGWVLPSGLDASRPPSRDVGSPD